MQTALSKPRAPRWLAGGERVHQLKFTASSFKSFLSGDPYANSGQARSRRDAVSNVQHCPFLARHAELGANPVGGGPMAGCMSLMFDATQPNRVVLLSADWPRA